MINAKKQRKTIEWERLEISSSLLLSFIYLFLIMPSLSCRAWLSLAVGSRGYSLVVVHRLLIVEAPLVTEHRL